MVDDSKKELLNLRDVIVSNFTQQNWLELGILTGCDDLVSRHPRLLRSLSWNDPDYSGNVLDVLLEMVKRDAVQQQTIKDYLSEHFQVGGEFISSGADEPKRRIYFAPSVFDVPAEPIDENLTCVMMPFDRRFDGVFDAIKQAAELSGYVCKRVDNIWEHSTVIQDIFGLIYKSFIVVCDFTGRNPNVFYEAGIAHTLGKHVVPITQSAEDVPFDLRHHRYLHYLDNQEGRAKLAGELATRLKFFRSTNSKPQWPR